MLRPLDYSRLAPMLGFELRPLGNMPGGWTGRPANTIFADNKVVHSGRWSARIERKADSRRNSSTLTKIIPIDFAGKTIELRGFLRTEDVTAFSGLWMREDADYVSLGFDDMRGRNVRGTTPWTEYSVKLLLHPDAKRLQFGVMQTGTGTTWADDLQLLVDGRPIWTAPRATPRLTGLETDHQFDEGSGIAIQKLSRVQVENLALLARIWGFLKYHDPAVTDGERHWDYDLFRVMPQVLRARSERDADAVLLKWVKSLGDVPLCTGCASLRKEELYFAPDLDWIDSTRRLGSELSSLLKNINDNRLPGKQFYVSKVPGVGNPSFDHELPYANLKLPDSGYQLLGLFRFWNVVEYWSPHRDLVNAQWDHVLTEFIPRFALAKDRESYKREVNELLASLGDGHTNVWDTMDARPPAGKCELPVEMRFIGNAPVVTGFRSDSAGEQGGLQAGDVITELDGMRVAKLIRQWRPYYPASNDEARKFAMSMTMTRGDCGDAKLKIRRDSRKLKLSVNRAPTERLQPVRLAHDLPGPAFRMLSKDVAYLKISSAQVSDAPQYVESAAGTKGLILDIRDYPKEFVVFALGSLLVDQEVPFARVTEGDLANPGAFHWGPTITLSPAQPHYDGKIVILVDETTMSAAEYAAMAFRSASHAIVVGSTTAGADGNVSSITFPGRIRTAITGIGIFYPDKAPTQRIGIVPDVEVRATIAGIRAGRDEVLEQGLRQILGRDVDTAEILKGARSRAD